MPDPSRFLQPCPAFRHGRPSVRDFSESSRYHLPTAGRASRSLLRGKFLLNMELVFQKDFPLGMDFDGPRPEETGYPDLRYAPRPVGRPYPVSELYVETQFLSYCSD